LLRFTLRLTLIALTASALTVLAASLLGRLLDRPQLTLLARYQVISHDDLTVGLRVTLNSYLQGDPILLRWSPDGRWLAYVLALPEGDQLHVYDSATGRTRFLAADVRDSAPSWSADSSRLAALFTPAVLCVITPHDGAQVCAADGFERGVAVWSPVGMQLAQTRIVDGFARLEIHEEGRAPRELARFYTVERLLWTSDGSALLVFGRTDRVANPLLHRVDASNGESRVLAADIARIGDVLRDGRLVVQQVGNSRRLHALDTQTGDLDLLAVRSDFWGSSLPLESPDGGWRALAGSGAGSRPRLYLSRGTGGWVDAGGLFSASGVAWRP
jgi:dipeptidyl aminopeptidase/acylaminoacyl peptidase